MPKAKKFVLPYDGDPYNSGTTKKTHRGMRSEAAMERKRNGAIAHRETRQTALQQCEDGELLDSDVVDVPPNIDEPQTQVIVAEDALLEVLDRPRKTRRGKRSEEAMERRRREAIAHREAKQAALQQSEAAGPETCNCKAQVIVQLGELEYAH